MRAPWLTRATSRTSASSEALWAGGYLHTGDIGFIDELGYLQVSDRIKDVIKTGGEWISSLELENIIRQHPAVSEVAVIGVPDEKWGERPLALVVLRDGAPDDAEAHPALRPGLRREGRHLQVRRARQDPVRRRDRQDERRQARQESAAREILRVIMLVQSATPAECVESHRISTGYSADTTERIRVTLSPWTHLFLMGNEAIGYGAVRAGAGFACAYPGTPSTEILETAAGLEGIHAEWCVNEKVALETAVGASRAGVRTHRQHEARRPQRGRRPAAHAHRDRASTPGSSS